MLMWSIYADILSLLLCSILCTGETTLNAQSAVLYLVRKRQYEFVNSVPGGQFTLCLCYVSFAVPISKQLARGFSGTRLNIIMPLICETWTILVATIDYCSAVFVLDCADMIPVQVCFQDRSITHMGISDLYSKLLYCARIILCSLLQQTNAPS